MPGTATKIIFGDGLDVTDQGSGVIRVDGAGTIDLKNSELDYVPFTGVVGPIAATTEAAAGSVVTGNPIVCDGSRLKIEFFCPNWINGSSSNQPTFVFYRDSTPIGQAKPNATGSSIVNILPLITYDVPSPGTHTYSVKAFVAGGTGVTLTGGAGGSGQLLPMTLRVTKDPNIGPVGPQGPVGASGSGSIITVPGMPSLISGAGIAANTLQTAFSQSIPGNSIVANSKRARVKMGGNFQSSTAFQLRTVISFGGVTLLDITTADSNGFAAALSGMRTWTAKFDLIAQDATHLRLMNGELHISALTTAAIGIWSDPTRDKIFSSNGQAVVDTSVAQTLQIQNSINQIGSSSIYWQYDEVTIDII